MGVSVAERQKEERLKEYTKSWQPSSRFLGELDSGHISPRLLRMMCQGDKMIAAMAESGLPKSVGTAGCLFLQGEDQQIVVQTNELEIEGFKENCCDRCHMQDRHIYAAKGGRRLNSNRLRS